MAMRKIARWRLFIAFLGVGALCGLLVGALSSTPAAAKVHADSSQRNLLVLLVSDARAETSPLLGAWLAASSNLAAAVDWVPLYPTLLEFEGQFASAHDALWVAPADLAGLVGLKPLREAGVWWDHVVLLDRSALDELLILAAAPPMEAIQSWAEPQRALHQQVTLIQSFCARTGLLNSQAALDLALGLLEGQAHASFTAFELVAAWDHHQAQGASLRCSHPWAD